MDGTRDGDGNGAGTATSIQQIQTRVFLTYRRRRNVRKTQKCGKYPPIKIKYIMRWSWGNTNQRVLKFGEKNDHSLSVCQEGGLLTWDLWDIEIRLIAIHRVLDKTDQKLEMERLWNLRDLKGRKGCTMTDTSDQIFSNLTLSTVHLFI